MEKQNGFFDPYNFNMPNMAPATMMPNMPPMNADMDIMSSSPTMYYEQQYMYYKYMIKMLEYKMKLREWEMMTNKDKVQK